MLFVLIVANKPIIIIVVMLSVIMLSVIMLSVIMLIVIMLSVIMLNVVAPSNNLPIKMFVAISRTIGKSTRMQFLLIIFLSTQTGSHQGPYSQHLVFFFTNEKAH
jgi:hypothetical protein